MYEKKKTYQKLETRTRLEPCWLLGAFVDLRWPSLAVVGCCGLSWAFVGFRGPVVGRTRVRLLVRTFMEPRKEKKIKKVSRTHVQIIVRVFGGLDRGNGGGKTHLKQKKGSPATLFLFYRPCCGKWGCFGLRFANEEGACGGVGTRWGRRNPPTSHNDSLVVVGGQIGRA